jgi:hypothetical protein
MDTRVLLESYDSQAKGPGQVSWESFRQGFMEKVYS